MSVGDGTAGERKPSASGRPSAEDRSLRPGGETPSARSVEHDGDVEHERIVAYARYRTLIEAQEGALEDGDLDRYEELTERAREMEDGGPLALPDAGEIGALPDEVADRLRSEVRAALAAQRRVRSRLEGLRDRTQEELRTLPGEGRRVRRYLEGAEGGTPRGEGLDLQL